MAAMRMKTYIVWIGDRATKVRAKDEYAALNKVKRAPGGWHWTNDVTLKAAGYSMGGAMVQSMDGTSLFSFEENG